MAFDYFQDQDEDQQQGQGQPKPIGGESQLISGSQPTQSGGAGAQPAKTSSGAFTNLNAYLDANKDQGFGGQVAGKVQSDLDAAEQEQKKAEEGFKQKADQGAVAKNEALIKSVYDDPTKVNEEEYAKQTNATYSGPQTYVDSEYYAPAWEKTESAASAADLTKNEAGRKAYLAKEYGARSGNNSYSGGQQKLDSLLLQQDPEARKQLEDVRGRAEATKNKFATLQAALDAYASGKKGETAATRQAAIDALTGARGKFDTDLAARLAAEKSRMSKEDAALLEALRSRHLTAQQAKALGLPENQGGELYGVDPASPEYFSPREAPSLQSFASADDYARAQALSRLAGKNETSLYDSKLAGTYDKTPNLNLGLFSGAVGSAKGKFDEALRAEMGKQAPWFGYNFGGGSASDIYAQPSYESATADQQKTQALGSLAPSIPDRQSLGGLASWYDRSMKQYGKGSAEGKKIQAYYDQVIKPKVDEMTSKLYAKRFGAGNKLQIGE